MSEASSTYDAVVVGSGPNGLSAAIRLAQEGLQVLVLEAKATPGGGTRTQELTEPVFLHDVCSAVHPTAAGSPFLSTLPLQQHGLEWVHPTYPFAHPLDDGDAAVAERSVEATAKSLGIDRSSYQQLFQQLSAHWTSLSSDVLGRLRIPKHPLITARFGFYGMFSADQLSTMKFSQAKTRALFAGCAAHSILPLEKAFSASFGLVLAASAHAVGWPFAKGGSASITKAMISYLESLGGTVECKQEVRTLKDIPSSRAVLFDLTPRQIARIASNKLPSGYKDKLQDYTYGPGVFKIDWALSEPVPWKNKACRKAGTLHLGGSFEEIASGEKAAWDGKHSETPYVLAAQPSVFDDGRAPEGKHTFWAYCHVPSGSTKDMTDIIEKQIERFAPGFRDTIISKHSMNTKAFEQYNPNYIGGDINGGAQFFKQLFGRPVMKWNPYKIPAEGLYICSSSTPPGGGVHGMCGLHAAETVLKNEFGKA
ncbi:phytoene desaturase family protein [Gracilimonas mengyeensis]|uniref:Phytoene dehydrogenase-related protein n=1 Tax=Gracilimonas mengyeensis TaxID=1302730 RepID=A0A521AU35_9BACT|nr:NAD(P)/FAD-dependent oxidoreductase [Gracilimonas mengyeensis]SMO38329.1 Phytoene dehydrogenase-related protein [Gracilimonas mengyeensis]